MYASGIERACFIDDERGNYEDSYIRAGNDNKQRRAWQRRSWTNPSSFKQIERAGIRTMLSKNFALVDTREAALMEAIKMAEYILQ